MKVGGYIYIGVEWLCSYLMLSKATISLGFKIVLLKFYIHMASSNPLMG